MRKSSVIIIIFSLFLFSCSSVNPKKDNFPVSLNRKHHSEVAKDNNQKHLDNLSKDNNSFKAEDKFLKKNSVSFVPFVYPSLKNTPLFSPKVKSEVNNNKFKINVENMPLNKFINFVFGDVLKESYFVGKYVRDKKDLITIRMNKPLNKSEFVNTILNILQKYGVSVENRNGTLFIVRSKGLQNIKVAEFVIGRKIPEAIADGELIASIIPFHYVNASTYTGFIKRFALSQDGRVSVIPNSNTIMIVDKAGNIKEAIKIINLFDRITFEKKKVELVKLEYLSVDSFESKLKKILPLEGIPISHSLREKGIVLVPLKEINSLLIVSSSQKWIDTVMFWKRKMDTIDVLGNNPRMFVYYPKNRRASDLARIFSQVKTSSKKSFGILPSGVKLFVDENRNAIVISAPPKSYLKIKNVLDKLDTLPKEVLIEVTIAEVTLTDNLQYGIEWYLQHSGKYNGILSTVGGLGLGSAGLNYSLITDTKKFRSIINMYAKKNLINVISSPRLVVLDNHQATINVGTQVPTVTSEATSDNIQSSGTTALVRTIQYRTTGVILTIKPTINSGGILTLDIDQEVSEPQINDTSKIDSPLILDRSISTSVVLKSGTTLLLGGLIKNNKSKTVNKVPLLGDIPLLGELFKTTSVGNTKTELIVEITPYIISSISEAERKTKAFESLISWFKKSK